MLIYNLLVVLPKHKTAPERLIQSLIHPLFFLPQPVTPTMSDINFFSGNTLLLVLLFGIVFMPQGAYAFGAGNIPSLAAVEGINFRHGDIEDTLATLAMSHGSLLSKLTGGKKFDGLAIKQVYFGNWLRDYSQAIDLGTLTKGISPDLIRIVLWIMSFTEFGYGTEEFEVTSEKLGVYRAEEHIDNPKGYGEGLDPRDYDKRLRGPVEPEELLIDPQTGMKNYIANEQGGWPTSSEYVRTSLQKCIKLGRKAREQGNKLDQFEAFRLLGQALHTLEDFSAHSNYCELVLISLGHSNVFPHVGEKCTIRLNGEKVYPLVTGTFGGQDFLHSLMGGAQDSLSQMELADIQSSLESGAKSTDCAENLKKYLGMIPEFGGDEDDDRGSMLNQIDNLRGLSEPTNDPTEIFAKVYPYMEFRDRFMKRIESFMEKVPLLPELKQNIADSLTLFIMSNIQPIISPVIKEIIDGLHAGTEMIVSDDEQFRVWNDPTYDNPTHSQLSKDHFAAYLNEPAGKIATVIVAHVVPLVVEAWGDSSVDPSQITDEILQVFHHPATAATELQHKMRVTMEEWINNLQNADTILESLTAEGCRNGKNLKKASQVRPQGEHTHTDNCGHTYGFNIPKPSQGVDNSAAKFNRLKINDDDSSYDRPQKSYGQANSDDDHGTNNLYNKQQSGSQDENSYDRKDQHPNRRHDKDYQTPYHNNDNTEERPRRKNEHFQENRYGRQEEENQRYHREEENDTGRPDVREDDEQHRYGRKDNESRRYGRQDEDEAPQYERHNEGYGSNQYERQEQQSQHEEESRRHGRQDKNEQFQNRRQDGNDISNYGRLDDDDGSSSREHGPQQSYTHEDDENSYERRHQNENEQDKSSYDYRQDYDDE